MPREPKDFLGAGRPQLLQESSPIARPPSLLRDRLLLTEQTPKRLQILLVLRIDGDWSGRLPLALGRFQQHRQRAKTAVVDDPSERLETQATAADVLVPVHPAAERPLRVV